MKRLCVALFLMFALFNVLSAADQSEPEKKTARTLDLEDCRITLIFARLWKYPPVLERETAVWIIVNAAGEYESIGWLNTPQRNMSIWSDPLPQRIIAVAHTHGNHLDPRPSKNDISFARRMNIPLYTVTRQGIWRAGPDGSLSEELARGWYKKTLERCGN